MEHGEGRQKITFTDQRGDDIEARPRCRYRGNLSIWRAHRVARGRELHDPLDAESQIG